MLIIISIPIMISIMLPTLFSAHALNIAPTPQRAVSSHSRSPKKEPFRAQYSNNNNNDDDNNDNSNSTSTIIITTTTTTTINNVDNDDNTNDSNININTNTTNATNTTNTTNTTSINAQRSPSASSTPRPKARSTCVRHWLVLLFKVI